MVLNILYTHDVIYLEWCKNLKIVDKTCDLVEYARWNGFNSVDEYLSYWNSSYFWDNSFFFFTFSYINSHLE